MHVLNNHFFLNYYWYLQIYPTLRRIFVQLQICTFIHSRILGACTTSLVIHSQDTLLLADSNVLAACHVLVLSYIEADHAIANMNEFTMFPYKP